MTIQIALLTALVLTLGTTMSAVAIQGDREMNSADAVAVVSGQQADSMAEATRQAKPAASQILILPRPL